MNHLWRVVTFVKGVRKYYIIISVLTIFVSLIGLAQPILTGLAIDEISKGIDASVTTALVLAALIFVSDVLRNIINNISGYYGDILGAKVGKYLGEQYYCHLLSLPKRYFDNTQTGQIINRLDRSSSEIGNFVTAMTNNFLQFIFGTVFALIAVAIYSWQVAILLAILYPLYTWLTLKSSPKWQEYQQQKNENEDVAKGRFNEAVAQIDVVKSYVQEQRELSFFKRHYQSVVDLTFPQSKHWHWSDALRRFALNIIFFAVFATIFYQGASGAVSAGQAVALVLYANQIRIPIFTISFLVDRAQRAVANSKDYFEVLQIEQERAVTESESNTAPLVKEGRVSYENVRFSYDPDGELVLDDISFTVEPGQKVAFVGESGEGKSTLVNLLMGLHELDDGEILIDDAKISEVDSYTLRRTISAVFQQPNLFSGTVEENIAYAKPGASHASVVKAAKAANAHDFITHFPKKYKSPIGERGLKLSGGQQQRIAIARALLKDAPILILDEATSSLDSKSEVEVQAALERLMHGRTTFIIAHRLSTIQHVDKIIVLKNGSIAESGSPPELAKKPGLYAELLALQNGDESAQERLKKYDITG